MLVVRRGWGGWCRRSRPWGKSLRQTGVGSGVDGVPAEGAGVGDVGPIEIRPRLAKGAGRAKEMAASKSDPRSGRLVTHRTLGGGKCQGTVRGHSLPLQSM